MRKQMRTFSGYAQAADPFIKLIPNDNGWNVLAGGLKLVFDVGPVLLKCTRLMIWYRQPTGLRDIEKKS